MRIRCRPRLERRLPVPSHQQGEHSLDSRSDEANPIPPEPVELSQSSRPGDRLQLPRAREQPPSWPTRAQPPTGSALGPREIGGSFASRRGHVAQLSISDTNHHVTEAIGDMYGDDDYSKPDSRPLSFVSSPLNEAVDEGNSYVDYNKNRARPTMNGNAGKKAHTSPALLQSQRHNPPDKAPLSPSLSLRDRNNSADAANAQFPLNDIDYESNPAAVAQELSNLQALRRMSMDVGNTSDPDLPSFQGVSLMPTAAPTGNDDEDDPSRLFWVPARVHPELAPMEFKTFLENRVQSIKRRSGDQSSLSPESIERSGSGGGLRRKKSMLSRQIDNDGGRGAIGYKDGSEQLERKKSLSGNQALDVKIADLKELDELVRDPSKAMQKLSLDMGDGNAAGGDPSTMDEDKPILPQAPGVGLRRSTRTTYRRGSLRKGERVPFSKRAGSLRGDTDAEESPMSSPIESRPSIGYPLTKVQAEPTAAENFSRPNRGARRLQNASTGSSTLSDPQASSHEAQEDLHSNDISMQPPQPGQLPKSNTFPVAGAPVPRIVETPPPPEEPAESTTSSRQAYQFPERSSSQTASQHMQKQPSPELPAKSSRRPNLNRQDSSTPQSIPRATSPSQTLNDMAQHPSPLPGSGGGTESLTFIPTFEDKKPEKKSKKEKDESDGSGPRKTSWGWFKGSDEKDKKDKKKDDDHHKESKRAKAKAILDKSHDNARLDVLQSTMDTAVPRNRESLLLDRDNIENKLQDERKKESSRKSGGENKKEKDGLFSSFFGGGKKKGDRDSGSKKGSSLRALSPDPPHRQLKPDVDYNWTRFSILEERAIYRMAHIKLANPRRALYSQVLLSNFMYSYLAKVQEMHPQMQIPQSALQKKQEAERRQKELEEQQQQQRQQGEEQYRYDYHQGITQYAESSHGQPSEGVEYVDDSQIYDYDHEEDDSNRPQSRASQHNSENGYGDQGQYNRQGKDYYQYGHSDRHGHEEDRDDEMW
ncbi:Uncharacterized protein BP5553_05920 [Venustampulla echinocandica]|uniref:Protein Zds1 C-terminal domain-containing protein n=1 Tax=Venustampulla echinocandica TaxID=2656787 RepID=A0A370TM20_9HELO|nr:Uncharacterized protein BP5553_05920 [Venustampulla echinocandica]RDL36568.1 Uncharacterized protein BP5553_05920 [Venustampulla echinocandica]